MHALLCVLTLLAAKPLALDNGAIRVEVDPDLFSLRFIGAPGGHNFLDPLHVEESLRDGGAWLDPGGLVSDVVPLDTRDAALRRGPAEVLEHSPSHLLMLGPESPDTGLRLKKELRILNRKDAVVDYTVTILSSRMTPTLLSLRNTVRIPMKSTLRTPRKDVEFRSLSGADADAPVIVKSMRYWLIPIPPTAPIVDTLLTATTPHLDQENRDGIWQRRVRSIDTDAAFEAGGNLMLLIDDASKSYGVAMQSPKQDVTAAHPLVFSERWELDIPRK